MNTNQTFSGSITALGFNRSGAGLTSLNAANVALGTLSDARLSANVAKLNANQTFLGKVTSTNFSAPEITSRSAGESLSIKALNGTGSGGPVSITAGNAGTTTGGSGGNLTLQAGSAVPQGGSGYTGQGSAGAVAISAGAGYNGVGGNVTISSGPNSPWSLTSDGFSKVALQGGTLNSGDGGLIEVEGGHNISSSGASASRGGHIKITSGNGVGGYTGGNILLTTGTGSLQGNVGINTNNPTSALHVNGTVKANAFQGNGNSLTNLSASNLTGTVSDSRLSGNVALLNASASFSGTITANSFNGNGSALTNVDADLFDGLTAAKFWKLNGNAGSTAGTDFIGTTDNQPVEIKVNNTRALRIEPTETPNFVGGSFRNFVAPGIYGAVIAGGGGMNSLATSNFNTNSVASSFGVISGGGDNHIYAGLNDYGMIGGGLGNVMFDSVQSVIAGGRGNSISNSVTSVISGGCENLIRNFSAQGAIAGGWYNKLDAAVYGFIGAGASNQVVTSDYSTIVSGYDNRVISGGYSTIVGGKNHKLFADYGVIAGGSGNLIQTNAAYATVSGGVNNVIHTNSDWATIGGGSANKILTNGVWATIPGGWLNEATDYAFAAGTRAKARHTGSFVWADISESSDFVTTATNQFLIRAKGGVGIDTTNTSLAKLVVNGAANYNTIQAGSTHPIILQQSWPIVGFNCFYNGGGQEAIHTAGVGGTNFAGLIGLDPYSGNFFFATTAGTTESGVNVSRFERMTILNNGNVGIGTTSPTNKLHVAGGVSATVFITTSDRNAKENFASVDGREVLEKVASLPIAQWNFKEMPGVPHMGPTAQDFHEAFGLGSDDKGIATVDEGGVALAAIQGLNQKVEEKEAQIRKLEEKASKVESLEKRVADLERLLTEFVQKREQ